MKNDKEYNNYIINFSEDNKAISYKDLKKEIKKENKQDCKTHLKLIKKELKHQRIERLQTPTIISMSTLCSTFSYSDAFTDNTLTGNRITGIALGTALAILAVGFTGYSLVNPETKERKEKIKELKKQKQEIKGLYEADLENRLASERKFIDSKKPYVKTK